MTSMGMKTTTLAMLALLALAGCGSNTERTDYKEGAGKGRPLDMPPDLVLPKSDGRYSVPEGSTEKSATYSEYAKATAVPSQACSCPQPAAAQPAAAKPAAAQPAPVAVPPTLQDKPDGSKSIVIAEPFDRCWLKVAQAVDVARLEVEDKDRSKGTLYLKGGNQLSIQGKAEAGKGERCEVSAATASGAITSGTKSTIDALYKALSK